MALIKRVLLFFLSLLGIIGLLIGATTSNAKDEFELDITEPNFRFYTIEWIDEEDEYNNKYVCGTKVSTFDHSGRKFVFEYYYILKDNNKIVTRFDLNAVQISFETIEPIKTENLEIKLYASIILKDGKEIIGGPRNEENNYNKKIFHNLTLIRA